MGYIHKDRAFNFLKMWDESINACALHWHFV